VDALFKHISSVDLHVDRQALRTLYSREMCTLLAALVSPRAEDRPSMRSILEWPYFQQHEIQTVLLRPDEKARQGSGRKDYDVEAAMPSARLEAAANQIARSFRRSRGRAENQPAPQQAASPVRVTQGFKELPASVLAAVNAGGYPGGAILRPHCRDSPRCAPKVSKPTAPTAYDSQVCGHL
jgi:hypothetical protein